MVTCKRSAAVVKKIDKLRAPCSSKTKSNPKLLRGFISPVHFVMPWKTPVPDLDGGGPGAQAWWEAPCAGTESLGRG